MTKKARCRLWLPNDHTFWSKFCYLEVARYRPEFDGVIREQHNHQPLILKADEIEPWRDKRKNLGLYTSVYRFDDVDVVNARRTANLYFDLDDQEGQDLAIGNARTLVAYLQEFVNEDALRIYFTGAKGFHVEIEAIALGVGALDNLPVLYRFIANGLRDRLSLETLDFHVYDARRMWRLPNSIHQKTHLYKVPLTQQELELPLHAIWELALQPREMEIPDQKFDVRANEWLREWMCRRFSEEGTRTVNVNFPDIKRADVRGLMERQIKRVREAKHGERNSTLNRAAYIVGRPVVSGLLDLKVAEKALLDAALDVGLEERESWKTIASGLDAARRAADV